MVIAILPALIPDVEELFSVYFDAFNAEDMGRRMLEVLFPAGTDSPEFRKAHAKGTVDWWSKSKTQHTWKSIETATGEIVGICLAEIYIRPRSVEERADGGAPWLEGEHRTRAESILGRLWKVREKLFGGRPYIHCHVIAVSPKHQGRKAGALWCNFGKEISERTQLPLYLEASPSTAAFYNKMGFQRIETVTHPAAEMGSAEDIVVPLMVHIPASLGITFDEWRAQIRKE